MRRNAMCGCLVSTACGPQWDATDGGGLTFPGVSAAAIQPKQAHPLAPGAPVPSEKPVGGTTAGIGTVIGMNWQEVNAQYASVRLAKKTRCPSTPSVATNVSIEALPPALSGVRTPGRSVPFRQMV
jgi:hypothetical protein